MRFWLVRFFSGPVMRTNRGLAVDHIPRSFSASNSNGFDVLYEDERATYSLRFVRNYECKIHITPH